MKIRDFVYYCLIWSFWQLTSVGILAQKRCATTQYDSIMKVKYPYWALKRRMLEDSIQAYLSSNSTKNARTQALCTNIKIPVVVHVIHNNVNNLIGGIGNSNIADEQIINQIRVLNEDYRRKPNTRGYNTSTVGADTGIEFYLATIDPDGKPTTGITRHLYTSKTTFDINNDNSLLAGIVSWPSDRYLNIWVTRYGSNFIGLAQFPSVTGITGLDTENDLQDRTDGVYIDFRVFGTGNGVISNLYKFGRTTTHEVGHWLGLIHTWGDTNCGDDYCADTPPTEKGNETSSCGPFFSNCNGQRTQNMIENYMDYSPDSCMNIFTVNQAQRMMAVLEKAPRRGRLIKYWCASVPFASNYSTEIYPNPASNEVNIKVIQKNFGTFEIEIYSITGQLMRQLKYEDYPSWVVPINTSDFATGTYIVRIKTAEKNFSHKLVVAR